MSFLPQPITIQNLLGQNRKFGPITVQVILNENTTDTLTITKQPVQTGAAITDHAFKEPTVLNAQMLFQDNLFNSLEEIYDTLLELQVSREPFDVITPKRIYESMLISSLSQTTDKYTENTLSVSMTFQQIVLVTLATAQIPRSRQRLSRATEGTQKSAQKSALFKTFGGG